MEKLISKRFATAMLIGVAGTLALTGCSTDSGQTETPTIKELRDEGEFFELRQPDGDTMLCWRYADRGDGVYGESPSWLTVTCDWSGENTSGPTTEAGPATTLPIVDELGSN